MGKYCKKLTVQNNGKRWMIFGPKKWCLYRKLPPKIGKGSDFSKESQEVSPQNTCKTKPHPLSFWGGEQIPGPHRLGFSIFHRHNLQQQTPRWRCGLRCRRRFRSEVADHGLRAWLEAELMKVIPTEMPHVSTPEAMAGLIIRGYESPPPMIMPLTRPY